MSTLPTWIAPDKAADMVFDVRAPGVDALGYALLRPRRKIANTAAGMAFAKLNPVEPTADSPRTRCGWPTTARDHRLVLAPGTPDPTSLAQLFGDYDAATVKHQRLLAAVLTVSFDRDRPLHDSFDELVAFATAYVARTLRLTSLVVLHAPGDQLADERPHGHSDDDRADPHRRRLGIAPPLPHRGSARALGRRLDPVWRRLAAAGSRVGSSTGRP